MTVGINLIGKMCAVWFVQALVGLDVYCIWKKHGITKNGWYDCEFVESALRDWFYVVSHICIFMICDFFELFIMCNDM